MYAVASICCCTRRTIQHMSVSVT